MAMCYLWREAIRHCTSCLLGDVVFLLKEESENDTCWWEYAETVLKMVESGCRPLEGKSAEILYKRSLVVA